MGTVTNLNSSKEVEEFVDFLFGVEDGFVYLPTKDSETGSWSTQFLPWPAGKKSVVQAIQTLSATREVYIAPVLYKEPSVSAVNIKGSSVVWAEFDGKIPTLEELDEKGSPQPTVRVKSSKAGHEHWYWKLDKFATDLKSLQDTNKALAYGLDADPSGWDIEQLLRPVGSLNHKRNGLPVTLVQNSYRNYVFTDFKLAPVEVNYSETDFDAGAIPNIDDVLLKYAWIASERQLIKSKAVEGLRSSMLTKLGYVCCEKGLDNSEIYSVIEYVDSRWGKFANRTNKRQCYIRLIDYVRQKHPYKGETVTDAETEQPFKYRIRGFMTHFNETENLEWIIPGLLHNSASMFIVGKSGSLKTALGSELCINLALGRSILNWDNLSGRPLKMMMWSLEMGSSEIKERQMAQVKRHTPEELQQLEENFLLYTDPEPVQLFNPAEAALFKEAVLEHKPDGLLIDSAQMSMSPDMSNEEQVKKSVRFLQQLRHTHNFFSLVIHHPRKELAGVKAQRMTLSDLFGSQTLANSASTVIGMQKHDKKEDKPQRIDLLHLKTRFASTPADYPIELNEEDFTFYRPTIALGGEDTELDLNKMAGKIMEQATKKEEPRGGNGLTF